MVTLMPPPAQNMGMVDAPIASALASATERRAAGFPPAAITLMARALAAAKMHRAPVAAQQTGVAPQGTQLQGGSEPEAAAGVQEEVGQAQQQAQAQAPFRALADAARAHVRDFPPEELPPLLFTLCQVTLNPKTLRRRSWP
jgi:hypothetical protein